MRVEHASHQTFPHQPFIGITCQLRRWRGLRRLRRQVLIGPLQAVIQGSSVLCRSNW